MATERPSHTLYGSLMIVGSMAIFGLVDNFIRIIAEEGGLWQFYLIRALMACMVIACYCLCMRKKLLPKRVWAVALRSFLVSGAILIYFCSLSVMPIAEAGATLFSSPIFLLIFSVLLFRTKVGPWRVAAVTAGFAGMILVLKPDPANLSFFTLLPLLAGILYALGQLTTRHLCADEDTVVVLLGFFIATSLFGLVGTVVFNVFSVPDGWILAAPFLTTGWVEPTGRFLFWTAVQCCGSLIAARGLIRGYQMAEPTFITVFEFTFVFFAGFWAWMLWNEVPDAISIFGIAVIIAAGIAITLRTRKAIRTHFQ